MKPARYLVFLLMALALVACQSGHRLESDMGIEGAPDWVNQGTQAVSNREGRLIQGVGMAPAMGDQSLQRATADARARAEVAQVMSVYVEATIKDYAEHSDGESDGAIERRLSSETSQILSGARILARWKHPESGDIYSFSQLDMDNVEQTLKQSQKLNKGFTAYLEKRPKDIEQLIEEEEGR